MKPTPIAACALLALSADRALTTVHEAESALRIETTVELEMETTAMSMVRDGEPMEGRGGGGGESSTYSSVVVDRYLEVADGAPSRVQRRWEELDGERTMAAGGEDRSLTMESDFEDLVVELTLDEDGEVAAEVVDGAGPDVEVLALLRPGLTLDAFLPEGEVAEGAEWSLEHDAVRRGLGLDVTLFRAPERDGGGRGGGGGGGGRRRGGFGRGGSGNELAGAEWSGSATFAGLEVFEEVECARIELELEGESERDDEAVSATFEASLEGTLWFDLEGNRPVGLQLEGSLSSEMDMTRERQGSVMEIHRASEGTYAQRVRVAPTAFSEDE